jgi:hypothetical protein
MAIADKAKDMVSKLMSKGTPAKEPEMQLGAEQESEPDGDEGNDAVHKDIDALVPGLGKLIQELVERCMAK